MYLRHPLLGILETAVKVADVSSDVTRTPGKLLGLCYQGLQLCDFGPSLLQEPLCPRHKIAAKQ